MSTPSLDLIPTLGVRHWPIEVIQLIIEEIISINPAIGPDLANSTDVAFSHHVYVMRFLRLRLVGKSWDKAILPFIFGTLRLESQPMARNLIRMWTTSFLTPGFPHLRQLYLDEVWHSFPVILQNNILGLPFDNDPNPYSILPATTASIIALCRLTLTHLKLRFRDSVGFTPAFANSIQLVTGLQCLSIHAPQASRIIHDCGSVRLLLENIPFLKSLSIDFPSLSSVEMRPHSLPDLEHFWLNCAPNNYAGATEICRSAAKNIKSLELFTKDEPDPASQIILSCKDTIESLFLISIPNRVPEGFSNASFPRLRVLRSEYCYASEVNLDWLNWPFLSNVEVFITSYRSGNWYWRTALNTTRSNPFAATPKLKHIIFTDSERTRDTYHDLSEAFESVGVHCHFMLPLTHAQIMDIAERLRLE